MEITGPVQGRRKNIGLGCFAPASPGCLPGGDGPPGFAVAEVADDEGDKAIWDGEAGVPASAGDRGKADESMGIEAPDELEAAVVSADGFDWSTEAATPLLTDSVHKTMSSMKGHK